MRLQLIHHKTSYVHERIYLVSQKDTPGTTVLSAIEYIYISYQNQIKSNYIYIYILAPELRKITGFTSCIVKPLTNQEISHRLNVSLYATFISIKNITDNHKLIDF